MDTKDVEYVRTLIAWDTPRDYEVIRLFHSRYGLTNEDAIFVTANLYAIHAERDSVVIHEDGYDMQSLKATVANLPKYRTTLTRCGCPSYKYGKGRACKHIRGGLMLVSKTLSCLNCGRTGQRLTPNLTCEHGCSPLIPVGEICVSCGMSVNGYKHVTVRGLFAHTGMCAADTMPEALAA